MRADCFLRCWVQVLPLSFEAQMPVVFLSFQVLLLGKMVSSGSFAGKSAPAAMS